MIFTARQLQEKCQEQNVDLYMTLVDLTKAFGTVSREGLGKLWHSLAVLPNSLQWCGSSTMVCLKGSKMMPSFLIHSLCKKDEKQIMTKQTPHLKSLTKRDYTPDKVKKKRIQFS